MAKKTAEEKKTEEKPAEAKPYPKTLAVREALVEGITGNEEIIEYAKTRHGIEIDPAHVSVIKSGQAKKLREASGVVRSPKARAGAVAVANGDGLTFADIDTVRELLARLGREKLERLVDSLA